MNWTKEFSCAITVCDKEGKILEMNERSARVFAADGGEKLVGSNALDCHPAEARQKLAEMLASGQPNIYTIEKNGIKKLIYQAPWFENGCYAGMVELSLEIPFEMPHFIRS